MSNDEKKPKKGKNQFMKIAQQAAEMKRAQEERDQQQADAAKSPPAILGTTDEIMRPLFGPNPQLT